jgi:homogentisate 1,2-dioxygenase
MAISTEQQDRPIDVDHWTREGFAGDSTNIIRPHHSPDYISVQGPHAPHRLQVRDLDLPDRTDPAALPLAIMVARSGLQLSVSAREAPTPFVFANVEADEVHFVQDGELLFETDHGPLTASAGDFVCIPRAIQYRVIPLRTPTLRVITEVPEAVRLEPPGEEPLALERTTVAAGTGSGGETALLVKSFDGLTRYVKPRDPLAVESFRDGTSPVWRLSFPDNLRACGGPPHHWAGTASKEALFYNLSVRLGRRRPPIHHNADYDELIYFVAGPGAYGRVNEPGLLTWVPKGIAHHGPTEDVPEGYVAWMLESRSTLRLTPAAIVRAELMELDQYGAHTDAQLATGR